MHIVEELLKVPEFGNVPREQLEWLASKGKIVTFQDGEKIFTMGDPIDDLRIFLKGAASLYMERGGSLQYFDAIEQYEISGRLPYSRMKGAAVHSKAMGETVVFSLHKDLFPEMVRNNYELTEVLVHAMTDRVREFTNFQQQNDKMVALGKLSAGLAHELNNPSAAVIRGAHELKKHLSNLPEKFKSVIRIKTTDETVDFVNELLFSKIKAYQPHSLSLAARTKKEDEIIGWLEDHDIEEGFMMAETFAEYCFTIQDFESLNKVVRPEDMNPIINWLYQVLTTERLVQEMEEASRRINSLVTSIKSYTHMDQAPEKQPADVHEGIRNTLTLLNHKIKRSQVNLVLEFQENLPKSRIYVSAMNQVWMNLVDNALDALEGRPEASLRIKTEKDREFIIVTIIDNGPGIPADIQDKIFDPFFTTKPIGKGTGLGLEMVRQIIRQHNGKVDVKSIPGKTEFRVCFPI